jgi:hypothetical protein
VDTNPDIVEVVLELLRFWRTAQPTKDNSFAHLNQAWEDQIIVGGRRMFEGWVSEIGKLSNSNITTLSIPAGLASDGR